MTRIWIINQHANTPTMPGHTRQYEIANGLSKKVGILNCLRLIIIFLKGSFFS